MSKEKDLLSTKIKYEVKPLTPKQRWNVAVRLCPWLLLIVIGTAFAFTYIGHWQAGNESRAVQDAVSAQVQSLTKK